MSKKITLLGLILLYSFTEFLCAWTENYRIFYEALDEDYFSSDIEKKEHHKKIMALLNTLEQEDIVRDDTFPLHNVLERKNRLALSDEEFLKDTKIMIQYFLDKGAKVDKFDRNNNTPLLIAVEKKYTDIVKTLIESGSYIDDSNNSGVSPLFLAIFNQTQEIFDLLIDKAKHSLEYIPQSQSYPDFTPLHTAVVKNNQTMVKQLLEKLNNYNKNKVVNTATNNRKMTPLHLAAKNGNAEIVKQLLQVKEIEINAKDFQNDTPLHYATSEGKENVVELLIALKDIDVNQQNNNNETPLHIAVKKNNEAIIKLLSKVKNIDPNLKSNTIFGYKYVPSDTPLHIATGANNKVIVEALLQIPNIDINLTNNNRETALDVAVKEGNEEIVDLLLAFKVDITFLGKTLKLAIEHTQLNIVKKLLTYNIPVNDNSGYDNNAPLHIAIEKNNIDIVRELLKQQQTKDNSVPSYAVIDINIQNKSEKTPLYLAVQREYVDIVTILLNDPHINPNIQDKYGYAPLHVAIVDKKPNEDVIKQLIQCSKTDVNQSTKKQQTPLFLAVEKQDISIIEQLCKRSDLSIDELSNDNKRMLTPLQLAVELALRETTLAENSLQIQIITKLLEHGADPNISYSKEIIQKKLNEISKYFHLNQPQKEQTKKPYQKIQNLLEEFPFRYKLFLLQKKLTELKESLSKLAESLADLKYNLEH